MITVKKVSSSIREKLNRLTRFVVKNEACRKKLVVHYYALQIALKNIGKPAPIKSVEELLSWRDTMSLRVSLAKEVYRGNVFYGAGKCLREYCGASKPLKACIEHGVHFGNYVNEAELDSSELPALVTFGSERLKHIHDVSEVPVCMIGPYIAYARGYLCDEDVKAARIMLGRTMLVFPSHSIEFVDKVFEVEEFMAEIIRIKNLFKIKTVLVSIYYRDLLDGAADPYEDAGFIVVTSGYREDEEFLSRQRSFIELSDLTISNSVGTHVGYCVYLGKPHYIYNQSCSQFGATKADEIEFDNSFAEVAKKEKAEVQAAFSNCEERITEEQMRVCEKYWGFSHVARKSEIKALFDVCESAFAYKSSERQKALIAQASDEKEFPLLSRMLNTGGKL